MNIFVIMPFGGEFDAIYRSIFKEPLEHAGHVVSRADDPSGMGIIYENIHYEIVQGLWDADYVLADLTNDKPNVYYELGIAHTLNKRTIRVSQTVNNIPFNIFNQSVFQYWPESDTEYPVSNTILRQIQAYEQGRIESSNIVHDFMALSSRSIITDPPARK